jgi:hypothetical protein
MDWNLPEPCGKIAIPSREYKGNINTDQKPPTNRPQSSQSTREEFKIQLPARPYQQPIPSFHPNPSFQTNPKSNIPNPSLKQKFEDLHEKLEKKLQNKLKQAEDDYKKRIIEIKQEAEQEKNDLLALEHLSLSDSLKNTPSIPSTTKDPAKQDPPKPLLSKGKDFNTTLLGYSPQESLISQDLKTLKPLKTPKDFSKGGGLLLLKDKQVLIVYGNGKASLLTLSQNKLSNLPMFPQPRSYFALTMIGKSPAVIGGILNSSTCSEVSILKNLNYWENGAEINIPRSHARGIKHQDSTYLFAGFSGGAVTSIEMFFNEWVELNVLMPAAINHFGLCSKNHEIFLFGGEDSTSIFRSVYSFDTSCEKFSRKKNLGEEFSCRNDGSVRIVDGEFYLLNVKKSNVIKYVPG